MGGSAVGTGLGADPGYMDAFYEALSDDLGEPVRPWRTSSTASRTWTSA